VSEGFLDRFGRCLAGDLAGALSADPVKDGKQTTVLDCQVAVLVYGPLGVQPSITDDANSYIHKPAAIPMLINKDILAPRPPGMRQGGRADIRVDGVEA
jgi:hypothetical protein